MTEQINLTSFSDPSLTTAIERTLLELQEQGVDLDSIKDTPQYHAFVSKLEIQIKNFQDPVFQNKIFDRYEDTLKDIEARIKQADKAKDKAATLQLLRLKASVLKDQLGASIKAREHNTTKEDMADAIQSLAIDAWETENDKVQ